MSPFAVPTSTTGTPEHEHGSNTDHMVTAAATITIPKYKRVLVNGTTTITSITAGDPEQEIILHFTSTAQITDGGNLFLAGNFTGSANRTLSLFCDGANWLETARSTN
jgi:hypothetical protein